MGLGTYQIPPTYPVAAPAANLPPEDEDEIEPEPEPLPPEEPLKPPP